MKKNFQLIMVAIFAIVLTTFSVSAHEKCKTASASCNKAAGEAKLTNVSNEEGKCNMAKTSGACKMTANGSCKNSSRKVIAKRKSANGEKVASARKVNTVK